VRGSGNYPWVELMILDPEDRPMTSRRAVQLT